MGYNSGTKKITAPVGIADVQHALGDASTDVGSLCKSANINMWAKYKPVSKGIINTYTQLNSDNTWKADTSLSDPWWTGLNNRYGLGFTTYPIAKENGAYNVAKALNSLAASINGGLNGWTYSKPSGSANYPYRLIDFNGYFADAPNPIQSMDISQRDITATSTSTWEFFMQYRESDRSKPITGRDFLIPEDILGGSLYTSVAIFKFNTTTNKYEAMAWATGHVWDGKGITGSSSSYVDGITSSTTGYDEARFKDGQTYYAIPVMFNVDLAQTEEGRSVKPTASGTYWVVAYPFSDFMAFNTHQAQTRQNVGWPSLRSRNILQSVSNQNQGIFASPVYLESSTTKYNGYYVGTGSGSTHIGVAIVNSTWNGVWGNWVSGQYAGTPVDLPSVTLGTNEKKTITTLSQVTLDLNTQWYVVIRFFNFDEEMKIELITPHVPST